MIPQPTRISWRPAERHPFESAWSMAQKFCRWNAARFAEFWALVAVGSPRPLPAKRCYMQDPSWLDREKFRVLFRLEPEDVRTAFADHYAGNVHIEVCLADQRHVRFCPSCAQKGFHTYLYDMLLLTRCPIHDEPLLQACPRCGQPICAEIARATSCDPYACRCGYMLWPSSKSPAFSAAELDLLRSAVRWLERIRAPVTARIDKLSIREADVGNPQGIIVNEAIRRVADFDPNVPSYAAKPPQQRP